ncbi:DUF4112 domain-containing protein [Pedobacter cryophilus]|uniref:DUF4112 domain-containing protein n=1 Tax=Pedobacter cryophilus TaxID=2571271 RepID=A0A4U1C723_9SPHI|nr:DUF4112 domain-containing protein [Pedobacter cryophilus]TKC00187.1 DUF4112 domain-containing protein [Pedobacter cryophilus]
MESTQTDTRLKYVAKISKLLDSQFEIGGFKFGIDPILNFIPFAGDGATTLVSLALVYTMNKHGASNKIVVKMLGNVLIDFILGAIPLLGWIFDFYFKANDRNLKLLNEHYSEGKHTGSAKGLLTGILIAFIVVMIIAFWAIWSISSWLFGLVF